MNQDPLGSLALHLLVISLVAIGGVNTVLPELHRIVVVDEGWLSETDFTTLFALAQAAPGPNVIFVTLIGWHVAGAAGALVATAAMSAPSLVLAYSLERARMAWGRLSGFRTMQQGLVPVTIGLVAASAWLITGAAASGWTSYIVTAASAGIMLTTKLHPIWVLGAAGLLGGLGLV